MGQKAYSERLKQIRMNPMDAELYQQFSSTVQKQVYLCWNGKYRCTIFKLVDFYV